MLILNEEGVVIDVTEKSIDSLKREQYKHNLKEDIEIEEFNIEEPDESEDNVIEDTNEADFFEIDIDPAKELAAAYIQFASLFKGLYPDCDALNALEDFLSEKGIDVQVEFSGGEESGDMSHSPVPAI